MAGENVRVEPETRYARSGDVSIAYQVTGEGPFDVVRVPPFVSHVELEWQVPRGADFYRRIASFCRLIRFDKRGTGMSDRVSGIPTLETRMDDVRAVMDAAGSERAALFGQSEGVAMSILFAPFTSTACQTIRLSGVCSISARHLAALPSTSATQRRRVASICSTASMPSMNFGNSSNCVHSLYAVLTAHVDFDGLFDGFHP